LVCAISLLYRFKLSQVWHEYMRKRWEQLGQRQCRGFWGWLCCFITWLWLIILDLVRLIVELISVAFTLINLVFGIQIATGDTGEQERDLTVRRRFRR